MRLIFPIASVLIAAWSIALDQGGTARGAPVCAWGLCRYDQITAELGGRQADAAYLKPVLRLYPGDPLRWSDYGEFLVREGNLEQAGRVFDRAVELGPNMVPVLMRAANFDFTQDRPELALARTRRILASTSLYDQILFSYLTAFDFPIAEVLDQAIPPDARAAQSWLAWVAVNGSTAEAVQTWVWMRSRQLTGEPAAVLLTQRLWQRDAYEQAQQVWADQQQGREADYLHPERIWNPRFELQPTASPLDWSIQPPESVRIERGKGLEIRFPGEENVSLATVRQFVTVRPGRYRFTADLEAAGLTTNQRPFFHIFDPAHPGSVNVEVPVDNTGEESGPLRYNVTVPAGTRVLQIQLERRRSEKFDSKIAGVVRLRSLSLR